MEGSGPGNGDGLFQVFGRRGVIRFSLLHKVFLDMLRSNQDQVNVSGRNEQGLTCTSEIVSVNSIFPIFAVKTRRRNASNLSADGSFMSVFGLYRSSAEGELSGNVTSVCGSGVSNGLELATNKALFSYLEKGALCSLCQYHKADIRREREFAEGKFVCERLCAYHLLDGSHV